jgi:hypothetical protein
MGWKSVFLDGGVALPEVPEKVKVPHTTGDCSDTIQAAIDKVSDMPLQNGLRGAVVLAAGIYKCSKTLTLHTSGVILRGSGSGRDGTIIQMTDAPHPCVVIGSKSDVQEGKGKKKLKKKNEVDDLLDNDNDNDDDDDDDDDEDEEINDFEQKPDQVFLPSSLHGSARHRKKLALNALTIVTEIGKPTLFITGTVNVNWPEIQSRLLKGQTAFDRPDVVTQVFRCRLTKFIENLKAGKYFGKKKLDYILYCIEYQWRGLPHFHMAVKLQDVQTDTEAESVAFIDEFIKAEMPKRENFPNMTDGVFNSYLNLVKKQMKHDCAAAANGCKSKKTDNCRRGYDRTDPVLNSFIDEDGFPQYRRRNEEDFRVVAHNPET